MSCLSHQTDRVAVSENLGFQSKVKRLSRALKSSSRMTRYYFPIDIVSSIVLFSHPPRPPRPPLLPLPPLRLVPLSLL